MKQALSHFPDITFVINWLSNLADYELVVLSVAFIFSLWIVWFIVKTVLIGVLRLFGCATPELYTRLSIIPWRPIMRFRMAISRWLEQTFKFGRYSTGGFSSVFATLTLQYNNKKLFIGRAWLWGFGLYQSIGLSLTKHVLIVAGTGSGKTSSIIGTISKWKGSVFALDPSSIITKTLARCDKNREWVRYAPYDMDNTAQFNVYDVIKEAMRREGINAAVKWSYRVSECFLQTNPNDKNPYFVQTSKGFFVGVLLHVLTTYPEDEHHLGTVRDLIVHGMRVFHDDGTVDSTPEEARKILYTMMLNNPAFNGAIAGAGAPFINASAETKGNLASTLQERTKILDMPQVRHFLMRSTRPISDLKTKDNVVVTLDIPIYSLREELNCLALLIQNMVAYTFESVKEKNGNCLFVVDEVQAQGYNRTLEVSLPVARSMGLYIIAITQDLEGLKAAYPKTYLSFIGNADFVLWKGTAHPLNLQQLCVILGKKTTVIKDKYTGRKSYREVNVMEQEQIARFLSPQLGNMIVTRSGLRPLRLKLDQYFNALPVWAYDADPDHKESLFNRVA